MKAKLKLGSEYYPSTYHDCHIDLRYHHPFDDMNAGKNDSLAVMTDFTDTYIEGLGIFNKIYNMCILPYIDHRIDEGGYTYDSIVIDSKETKGIDLDMLKLQDLNNVTNLVIINTNIIELKLLKTNLNNIFLINSPIFGVEIISKNKRFEYLEYHHKLTVVNTKKKYIKKYSNLCIEQVGFRAEEDLR